MRYAAALLLSVAGTALGQAQDGAAWEAALARYKAGLERPSLHKRTQARVELAHTRDPRALDVLAKSYDRPEEPAEQVRYLIASIAMDAFRGDADPAVLAAWRKRHADAADAWLWFETTRHAAVQSLDALCQDAAGTGDALFRAVALEAIADGARRIRDAEVVAACCVRVLSALPQKERDRTLLAEAVASVLASAGGRPARSPMWRPVIEALIRQLDDAGAPQRTKVVVARRLARAFGIRDVWLDAAFWRGQLDNQAAPRGGGGGGGKTTAGVPFFSLRTTGFRFLYVIDASDSMLARMTDRAKRVTGPATGPSKPPPKGEKGFVPDADDIDWNRVVTRFDCAREYLRLSLSSLGEEHAFAIVLFGDEGLPLESTPKLVPATKRNVKNALAELDKIEPGPPTAERPDGQLRGRTNLHSGLARAFKITSGAPLGRADYVDPRGLAEGCDTVFLLSDGEPSWDDWAADDRRDPEDQAGDPETGKKYTNVPTLTFPGPYAMPAFDHLLDEVRRLNLFRKCEIHCVGIGEASQDLLQRIANVGLGQSIRVENEKTQTETKGK